MNKFKVIKILFAIVVLLTLLFKYYQSKTEWKPIYIYQNEENINFSALQIKDDMMFISGFKKILIFDVSNPTKPALVNIYQPDFEFEHIQNIEICDEYLYIIGYDKEMGGIEVVTISDHNFLEKNIQFIYPKMRVSNLFKNQGYIYLAVIEGYQKNWYILDLDEDFSNIQVMSKKYDLGNPIFVLDERVYVKNGIDLEQIIDISTPLAPIIISEKETLGFFDMTQSDTGEILGIDINEQLHYINLHNDDFTIIPNPKFDFWAVRDLEIDNNYLYVADTKSIRVISLEKEGAFIEVASYDGWQLIDIEITNNYVYSIDSDGILYIFKTVEK